MTRKKFESLSPDKQMALICLCGEHNCTPKDIGDIEIKHKRSFVWSWKFPFLKVMKNTDVAVTWTRALKLATIEGRISI